MPCDSTTLAEAELFAKICMTTMDFVKNPGELHTNRQTGADLVEAYMYIRRFLKSPH